MPWLGLLQILALLAYVLAKIDSEDRSWNDYEKFIANHEQVTVTQHTKITRRRRSISSIKETASFSQDMASYSHWYDFPEKMTFSISTKNKLLELNFTRNDYAKLDLYMSDESGQINNDYASRFGVYYSVEQGASVLVECEGNICFLHGTIEIDGTQYHIEQDHSSERFDVHTIRRKALPNMEEFIRSLRAVPVDGENHETSSDLGLQVRKRRSTHAIPDCDIIEIKALLDKTIWDEYIYRYGGDTHRAYEEIWKYFVSTFAEVDFRLKCLNDYFTHYEGECVVKCLRAILVDVVITKTSSWTDGKFLSGGYGLVRGQDGLHVCGQLNADMPGPHDRLLCFTRENIADYEHGKWRDYFRTVVRQNSICSSNPKDRAGIVEAKGDGVDISILYGLLKAVGARDDKSKSCSPNGYFIMREPKSEKANNPAFWGQSWYFSDCTTRDICEHVKSLHPNCMRTQSSFDEADWKKWISEPLPGDILSVDEQCKVRWGNDSEQCDPTGKGDLFPENMCGKYIYCTSELYPGCQCKVRVSSGSPCGFARVCLKGECVFTKDVPLGDKCECHTQCAVDDSACDPDTGCCVCQEGFFDDNGEGNKGGNCTEKSPPGGKCHNDNQCKDPYSRCIDGTCRCRPGYYDNHGRCEKQSCLGDTCNTTAQCKDDYAVCDPHRGICICATGYFVDDDGNCVRVNGTICDPCIQHPDTCTQSGTYCSDRGFCECSNDTVEVHGECFGTRVTERCTHLVDTCVDKNAECNGTVCVCEEDFVWNGTICVGPNPCDPCDPSTPSCNSHLVCSPHTYRCECPQHKVQIGDDCYGTRITDPCTTTLDTCVDDYAVCNGTVCDCAEHFIWNGSYCVGKDLCDPCDPTDSTCAHPLVCSSHTERCECPPGRAQYKDMCYGTRVTEPCTTELDTCVDKYACCNGTVCDCVPGFIWNGTYCVGPDLCDPCDPHTPSCDYGLVCNQHTYRCECPDDRVQIGNRCYGTRVTDPCTHTLNTCVDDCAGCNGTVCDCLHGFSWNGKKCVGTDLCDPCDSDSSTCASHLVCNSDTHRCECPPGYVQIGDNCYGRHITEPCTTTLDTCIDDCAECNGTVCDCKHGFVWNGTKCVGRELCDACDPNQSTCRDHLVCSHQTYRCECPDDEVQIGDHCYGTRVTEPCTPALDTCVDKFACCNGTICDCVDGFIWNGTKCVGPDLCDPCDPDTLSCDHGLVCSEHTYRCICPAHKVQIGDMCYGTRVTEDCTPKVDSCIDDYAVCNGTVCDCKVGFTWNGSICVGHEPCDPCDPSQNTCNEHLICSPHSNRCECPPNKVQIGDACYGTRITEPCTPALDTCVDKFACCNGTVCDCEPGFIWNGTDCVGDDLCDPCDPKTPSCAHHLVCGPETHRCECPPDYVQIADHCFGTRVTEPCTTDLPTCIDRFAECNGTVCDCEHGFVWNGYMCVGHDLCDPCDPYKSTCDYNLVCSPHFRRCECPNGQVQIADRCYGTHISDPCTPALDTCVDTYACCNGTVCDCEEGFIWNGWECVGHDLCDPCDPKTPSCDPLLVCNPHTNRCECPHDEVQIKDMCYGTRIDEKCTIHLDTCVDPSAECRDDVCKCLPGFIWNGAKCVGPDLCDPCDPYTPSCDYGLVCNPYIHKCSCPRDKVQIGDQCYGTRVTESCTTKLDTCVDKFACCNGTVCDCVDGFIWNGWECVGHDLCDPCDPNTPSCDPLLVCNPHTNRCECPHGEVQIKDMCYGTRVTEPCTTSLNTCIDDYAECNGTVCDCKDGYVWNGTICVGSWLCDPCDLSTPSCDDSLVCNPHTDRCECPTHQVQIGDHCYGTRITEPCTTDLNTCIDDCATCNGTVCDCEHGFSWNGSLCVGDHLCDPCDPSYSTCSYDLVCSSTTYRCECPPDEVQIGDHCYGTRVTEECTTDLPTCVDDYAECNGTVCSCIAGFSWNGHRCLGSDLCDPCDPHSDPSTCNDHLVCNPDTSRCECPTYQAQIGDQCVGTRVTEPCTHILNTCTDDYATCNGTVCDCVTGFIWNGHRCVGPDLCDPCDPNTPSCSSHLVCGSDTHRCECPHPLVQVGDHCVGTRVTEPCVLHPDTCIDDYAKCNGTICDCKHGFTWNGQICVGTELCDPCDQDIPCLEHLVCNVNTSKCSCPPHKVQIGQECYGTLIGEDCTPHLPTCTDDYAECNGTTCDCAHGFIYNGSKCVGPDLCDPCDPSTLSCRPHLVCSHTTYRCECPSHEVQIGDKCYGTRVTERCTDSLPTCTDNYAECNGTVCDCQPHFIWNGSICVGKDLCDPCDPSTPSCDDSLVCNTHTYRCECPTHQVQIGDHCYGTRVTEECTHELDTCVDKYAECNGTVCDCSPHFIWNGSICVGKELCDPCDHSDSTCEHPLVCGSETYRCECPPGFVQVGDFCYGTRVTESCTTHPDTCIDHHADCNGTVCDCVPGFTWNGTRCVGTELCDPCDPSLDTCENHLVCSEHTRRCECPIHEVQVGDHCYGTRVTEKCTTMPDTCIDDNAKCNGTVCDCVPGFTWNGTICLGEKLCDPCDPSSSTCAHHLVCSWSTCRCECPQHEVQIGDACFGTRVTERCKDHPDTCTDNNAMCNGTVCDCMPGFIWNGSICVGCDLCDPCDPSTASCSDHLVCSSHTNRCECPPNKVQIGHGCFGTLVTMPCTHVLDTCVDDFAVCNGTICDCEHGFIWNGTRCVGHDIWDPCDPQIPCDYGLVCNPHTFRCDCPTHQVQIKDMCYGTRITEACIPHLDTCTDDFAECNGTICDCIHDFVWNGSCCVGKDLCDPCDPSMSTCSAHLVCGSHSNRCECPLPYAQIGDNCFGTRVTEPCTPDVDTCTDDNACCNGTTCDCVPGFIWNGHICVGQDLCDPCDPSSSTCSSHLVCSNHTLRCECPSDEVQIKDACYGRLVTEVCTLILDTCIDDYACCNGTVCDCISGFIWNGSRCVGSELCDPCDPAVDSCGDHLVCNPHTYICECPDNQVQIKNACYGTLVTETCTPDLDVCIDDFAGCNGTICDCLHGYIWNGSRCVGCDLCDPCDPATPSCASPLECSHSTFRCECPSTQAQVGNTCVGTRVGEPCTPTIDTCIDDNAGCDGDTCDCLPGYFWNGTLCVGTCLCEPCDPHNDTCKPHLVCGSDTNRCECPPHEVQIGDNCYGTRVTEPCTHALDTCTDNNAECNGTVCDCKPGYVWNGTLCVGSCLCDPCDQSDSTCAPHLVCGSDTNRCECPPHYVQIGDNCYGRRVMEMCTDSPDTCTDDNAHCNGTVCDCKQDFIWNGSICVGPDLCDPCDPSTPSCQDCFVCNPHTYRCECPTDHVQIGETCYGTRVGESCTHVLDTCTDYKAECNGTICDCMAGFTWNGSMCVGKELCEPCDPASSTCEHSLVCNPTTYRCECPTHLVQIGDECHGTRVGESCTHSLNTCIDDFAECNGTTCVCEFGFIWNGSICVGPHIWDPCDPSTPSCDPPLVCDPHLYRCSCPDDEVQIKDECYGRLIGERCTPMVDTCIDDNAACTGEFCTCISPFSYNAILKICVGPDLDDPCDASSCGAGLTCGTTSQRCECLNPPLQIDNVCYGTRVGESCTNTVNTCIDDNAICSGGVCVCMTGFTWNTVKCVGKELDDPCDNSAASCSSNGLVCGPTEKCECPDNQVQVNNTCLSLICGPCDDNNDCIGGNQSCSSNICQCDQGFYLDNCSICTPQFENNQSCDGDVQCLSGFCVCGICQPNLDDDCCEDCDEFLADIIIITDNSGSVTSVNYQKVKSFVVNLVNAFVISPTQTQIGVVDYSRRIISKNTFNMTTFSDKLALTTQVNGHTYAGSFTRTDLALRLAANFFLSSDDRPTVRNYCIVITDGMANNGGEGKALLDAIDAVQSIPGTLVYSVGIGDEANEDELKLIASDDSLVFPVADFDALDTIINDLLASICGEDNLK